MVVVPDRGQSIANVLLVEIGHRHLAKLWQDVKLQRREPSTGLAVSLEFSLARLEGVFGDIGQQMDIPCSLPALALPFLDRVFTAPHHGSPTVGGIPRLFQRDVRQGTKPHFPTPTMYGIAEHPLSAAVIPLVEPEAGTIRILAGTERHHSPSAQAVHCPHAQSTFFRTISIPPPIHPLTCA